MELTTFRCNCGNQLTIQSIAIKLGIVKDCAHCGIEYPRTNHEKALQKAVSELSMVELEDIARENK